MLKDDNTIEDLRDNHSKLNLFKDEKQAIELFAFPQCFVEMIFEYPDTGETALDFNSLYPSIIMEQNLSMEKKITEAIDVARGAGCKELVLLHCI